MLPVVCIFGKTGIKLLSSPETHPTETNALTCHCYAADDNLADILIQRRPHVIVSFGVIDAFRKLLDAPFDVRRRWLHYTDDSNITLVGAEAWACYQRLLFEPRDEQPLISVFTSAFRPGDRFQRPLSSLKAQTYTNWEWVIVDDSADKNRTAKMLEWNAAYDPRINVIRRSQHSGRIGDVKYAACAATRGRILVELDHDDELAPDALQWVYEAYRRHPDAGFYFTDFAEVDSQLKPLTYGEGWGWGLGSYYGELFRGRELMVAKTPPVSSKTIRGLVAAPNHLRAWRRDVYFNIGGHNRDLHVADDMDLMIRTFLHTRMVHIQRLGYVQYHDGGNAQRLRNADIQRHVRMLAGWYEQRIHERFEALGIDDYAWDANFHAANMGKPNPETVANAAYVIN